MEIDKVYYYNRNGTLRLTLNEHPYWCDGGEFKDWEWSYDESFSRFRNFRRTKQEYPLTISIVDQDKASRDVLCDIFDEDVQAGEPGYLMINGWKLSCYIVEAERSFWAQALDYQIDFKIVSETSTWTREKTTSYSGIVEDESEVDLGRDYSMEEGDTESGRGYETSEGSGTHELMDSFGELLIDSDGEVLISASGTSAQDAGYGYSIITTYSDNIKLHVDGNGYRVTFYGAAIDPVIYLNGNPVRVLTSINANERLVVTSNGREKTIYKIDAQGNKTDFFLYRDKEHTPFFSIGKNTALSYGEIKFDFTTIENRSEPSWN